MNKPIVTKEVCGGCIYYRLFGYMGLKACHFALDNQFPRAANGKIEPVERCTHKLAKKEVMILAAKIDSAKAREMLEAGATTKEIALVFGVGANSVWAWKNKNGLKGDKAPVKEQPVLPRLPEPKLDAGDLTEAESPDVYDYDPLIYDVFTSAIAHMHQAGNHPGFVWRQLLAASERQLLMLKPYLSISTDACERAIELAALAVVSEAGL